MKNEKKHLFKKKKTIHTLSPRVSDLKCISRVMFWLDLKETHRIILKILPFPYICRHQITSCTAHEELCSLMFLRYYNYNGVYGSDVVECWNLRDTVTTMCLSYVFSFHLYIYPMHWIDGKVIWALRKRAFEVVLWSFRYYSCFDFNTIHIYIWRKIIACRFDKDMIGQHHGKSILIIANVKPLD